MILHGSSGQWAVGSGQWLKFFIYKKKTTKDLRCKSFVVYREKYFFELSASA
jgi:hypothetical protein